jgi:hypothetical protein
MLTGPLDAGIAQGGEVVGQGQGGCGGGHERFRTVTPRRNPAITILVSNSEDQSSRLGLATTQNAQTCHLDA